MKRWIEWSPS